MIPARVLVLCQNCRSGDTERLGDCPFTCYVCHECGLYVVKKFLDHSAKAYRSHIRRAVKKLTEGEILRERVGKLN